MELATSRFFGTTKGHKKERKFKYRTTIDTIEGHKKPKQQRKEHNRKIPGGILRI
jgi:hypothetical protein